MKQWIWLKAALLVWALSIGHAMATPVQGKVVAVVYDNSGSMAEETDREGHVLEYRNRWVYANYAMKFLAASLRKEDTLIFVPLQDLQRPRTDDGNFIVYEGNLDRAIDNLNTQNRAGGGTPYEAIRKAIKQLELHVPKGRPLWLVVITDGVFQGDDNKLVSDALPQQDAAWLKEHKVDVRFVLIGAKTNTTASTLTGGVKSRILQGGEGPSITWAVANLAESINGFSHLPADGRGRELLINAPFPLRRVMVLKQDSISAELKEVLWDEKVLAIKPLSIGRMHDSHKPAHDLPTNARVYKIEDGDKVLPANKPLKLVFESELDRKNLDILVEVAASYSMAILDEKNEHLKPVDGAYIVCGKYKLKAILKDDAEIEIPLKSRSDANAFNVVATVGGKEEAFGPGVFEKTLEAGTPGTEAEVTSTLTYPDYLNRTDSMKVKFGGDDACHKDVTLTVHSGVDKEGVWRSPVDQTGRTDPVILKVEVDEKPATVDQLKALQLETGAAAGVLEVKREAGGSLLLRPRNDCCLWWWRNPGPGEYPLGFKSDDTRYKIKDSPSVKFVLEPPRSLLDKVLWYGCPFALLALILAIVWYVIRLLRKARFGEESQLETEDRPKEDYGGVIRPSTVVLREECSAPKRWLWPSKAEVAVVRGLRFIAEAQGDVRIDGRDLGPKHRVPGWVFDRSRVDAPSARERRQEDAAMSDNVVLKIDEGASEVWMRYRA